MPAPKLYELFEDAGIEPIYFTTSTGRIGLSPDEGDHIITHTGRVMVANDAWTELDCDEEITDECRLAAITYLLPVAAKAVAAAEARRAELERQAEVAAAQRRWEASPEYKRQQARKAAELKVITQALLRRCFHPGTFDADGSVQYPKASE